MSRGSSKHVAILNNVPSGRAAALMAEVKHRSAGQPYHLFSCDGVHVISIYRVMGLNTLENQYEWQINV